MKILTKNLNLKIGHYCTNYFRYVMTKYNKTKHNLLYMSILKKETRNIKNLFCLQPNTLKLIFKKLLEKNLKRCSYR